MTEYWLRAIFKRNELARFLFNTAQSQYLVVLTQKGFYQMDNNFFLTAQLFYRAAIFVCLAPLVNWQHNEILIRTF